MDPGPLALVISAASTLDSTLSSAAKLLVVTIFILLSGLPCFALGLRPRMAPRPVLQD